MKKYLKTSIYAAIMIIAALNYSCKKDEPSNNSQPYKFSYGGHEYKVVKSLKTWADAAKDAVAQGGYLVEIGSQAEQDAVYQGILNAGVSSNYTEVNDGGGAAYVWIGGTDKAMEGFWLWNGANKEGIDNMFWFGDNNGASYGGAYVNWGGKSAGKYNEPDNFTNSDVSPNGQDVAAIGLANWPVSSSSPLGKAGEWNDLNENNKLYYVIEIGSESSGLAFTDIVESSYSAAGTPLLDTSSPKTWTGNVLPKTTDGFQYYEITNWANAGSVYCDFKNGIITIDDYTDLAAAGQPNKAYFCAVAYDQANNKVIVLDDYKVNYDKSKKILDFSGTHEGKTVYVGIVWVDNSGNVTGVSPDLYANAKLTLTASANSPAYASGFSYSSSISGKELKNLKTVKAPAQTQERIIKPKNIK